MRSDVLHNLLEVAEHLLRQLAESRVPNLRSLVLEQQRRDANVLEQQGCGRVRHGDHPRDLALGHPRASASKNLALRPLAALAVAIASCPATRTVLTVAPTSTVGIRMGRPCLPAEAPAPIFQYCMQ